MKKYLKKLADVTSYKFESNWCFWIDNGDDMDMQESTAKYDLDDFFGDAKEYTEGDFAEAKSTLIEVANNNKGLNIVDMDFELKDNYTAIMTVKLNDAATREELDKIKEYLIGQYADGWGEGLEQHECTSFDIDAEVEPENDEGYIEYNKVTGYVFVKLWPRHFRMTYSSER